MHFAPDTHLVWTGRNGLDLIPKDRKYLLLQLFADIMALAQIFDQ